MRAPPIEPQYGMGDVLAGPEYGGFALSSDGRHLALARVEYVKHLGARLSRVAVLPLDEEQSATNPPANPVEELVFTGNCDGWAPEFDDVGEALLFLSDYAGEARPWIVWQRGETPSPVASVTRMAVAAKWQPAVAAPGIGFLSFATRAEQGMPDPIDFGTIPAAGFRHLYFIDDPRDPDRPPRPLTSGPEDVYDYAFSPDGTHAAVLVAPSFEMERHLENELRILRLSDGEVVARHATERGLNAYLSWSAAGTHLAWIAHGAGGRVGRPELYLLRLADGRLTRPSRAVPGYVHRYEWAPGGRGLYFPAAEGVRSVLYYAAVPSEGAHADFAPPRAVLRPPGFIGGLAVARHAPRIALRLEGPRTPPCLAVATLHLDQGPDDGSLGPLRAVTPRSARKEARIPGEAAVLTTRGSDGHTLEALILHPRRGPITRRPVCIWLHGGPSEFCALSYQPWWQLFVARGYLVLAPNFRGSGSSDEARVRSNVGDLGGGDADDVLACLDALGAHPELGAHADTSRVVLFGWSYGAFLAMHVARKLGERDQETGRPSSLRRVVAGGGVYDWLSHYGQSDLRFPWRDYLGASPFAASAFADARSPVRFADRLAARHPRCQFLLAHGLNDGRAHPLQSRVMYRALREASADATLLLYPREAHVLVEPEHVRDLLDRATASLT